MEQEKKQVNAVHEKDLIGLLERLGIKEKFENNELRCKFCEEVVNIENIYSVLPESESVNLICDKPKCITALMGYLDEKNKTKTEQ
jgi:hypothetical protein